MPIRSPVVAQPPRQSVASSDVQAANERMGGILEPSGTRRAGGTEAIAAGGRGREPPGGRRVRWSYRQVEDRIEGVRGPGEAADPVPPASATKASARRRQ